MFILVLLALGVYGITVFANGSTTDVNVSGKLDITENGIYDISDKEYVDVDVAVPDNYVDPDGTLLLSSNGLYNVETYESVNVNINTDVILDVEELPYIGYKGTAVPNSGFIENIYVNLNLSNDEFITYVDNLDFIDAGSMLFYPILCNESKNFILGILKQDDAYILTDFYMFLSDNIDINKFYGAFGSGQSLDSVVLEFGFSGWNPSFNGIINLNDNAISYDEELFTMFNLSSDYVVGCENSVISSLVSISEFEFIESDFKKDILYRCDNILYCFLDNKFVKILTEDDLIKEKDFLIIEKTSYVLTFNDISFSNSELKKAYETDHVILKVTCSGGENLTIGEEIVQYFFKCYSTMDNDTNKYVVCFYSNYIVWGFSTPTSQIFTFSSDNLSCTSTVYEASKIKNFYIENDPSFGLSLLLSHTDAGGDTLNIRVPIDITPTSGSNNLISSDGVYTYVEQKKPLKFTINIDESQWWKDDTMNYYMLSANMETDKTTNKNILCGILSFNSISVVPNSLFNIKLINVIKTSDGFRCDFISDILPTESFDVEVTIIFG